MGVGRPQDIVSAVLRGIDMFDCVMPTRHARNGHLFTSQGVLNIRNAAHPGGYRAAGSGLRLLHLPQTTRAPICGTSTNAAKSSAAGSNTIHNLHYYLELMRALRNGIETDTLAAVVRRYVQESADVTQVSVA